MYILTSDGKTIVDSRFVEKFCVTEKPDAVLIVAGYGSDRAVVLGRFADRQEAEGAFAQLLAALAADESSAPFAMPDSRLTHGEKWKRDARTARRGGS